jgi:hypothetical protein
MFFCFKTLEVFDATISGLSIVEQLDTMPLNFSHWDKTAYLVTPLKNYSKQAFTLARMITFVSFK